jgi:hypothetical protein
LGTLSVRIGRARTGLRFRSKIAMHLEYDLTDGQLRGTRGAGDMSDCIVGAIGPLCGRVFIERVASSILEHPIAEP